MQEEEKKLNYPLSYNQRAIWFLSQFLKNNPAYNTVVPLHIKSPVDITALKQTFRLLIARHPILRTVYSFERNEPAQHIETALDEPAFEIVEAFDLSQAELHEKLAEATTVHFDLEKGPVLRLTLFKLGSTSHILLLVIHHIAIDFWSYGLLLEEFGEIYSAEINKAEPKLSNLDTTYNDFVVTQAQWVNEAEGKAALAYWKRQLAEIPTSLNLPLDRPRAKLQTFNGATISFKLDTEIALKLKNLCKKEQTTLYTTLLAAFQLLLHRLTNQSDIVIGSFVSGRRQENIQFERVIGYFVNTIVLRSSFNKNLSFLDYLKQIKTTVAEATQYQNYPFSLLVENLAASRDASRSPIFQVAFVYQKYHLNKEFIKFVIAQETGKQAELGGLIVEPVTLKHQEGLFDLSLEMAEIEQELYGRFKFNTDLFNQSTIQRILDSLFVLLDNILENPAHSICTLGIIHKTDLDKQLQVWNATATKLPAELSLAELFEHQVKRTPFAVALTTEQLSLTYNELNKQANQLANYLRRSGVKPGSLVGVYLERSKNAIVGFLAVVKAGAAFVPLDPEYPLSRIKYILKDCEIEFILTRTELIANIQGISKTILDFNQLGEEIISENAENLQIFTPSTSPAYILYTSGSTGEPKGVIIPHQAICNRLVWGQSIYKLSLADKILQITSLSFDFAVWEIFGSLLSGANLVLFPYNLTNIDKLIYMLEQHKITVIHFIPSFLQALMEYEEFKKIETLRIIFVGGEPLNIELLNSILATFQTTLYNQYGPTETAIDISFWLCKKLYNSYRVPIGRPIYNIQFYVLDQQLQIVPLGVSGELFVGGLGLATGYINRPQLTAEKFIPDPFSGKPGARLYKTGDLVRYLETGELEFLGRLDQQVKVRGYRIELGEIETLLNQYPGVQQSLVTLDTKGRLHAYLVATAHHSMSKADLQNYLQTHLPEFMLPSLWTFLKNLPTLHNGKIDKKQLEKIDASAIESDASDFIRAANYIESELERIWSQLLAIKQITIFSNFFELGGHSILALQLAVRLRQSFSIEINISDIFEFPTIATLAEHISRKLLNYSERKVTLQQLPTSDQNQLSFAQQGIWFFELLTKNSATYNIPALFKITGNINHLLLEQAINEIMQRHIILRAGFINKNGFPEQIIAQECQLKIKILDQTTPATDEQLLALFLKEANLPIDLTKPPLFRVSLLQHSENIYFLLITFHHIIFDGWSLNLFFNELNQLYTNLRLEKQLRLADLPAQFTDYVLLEKYSYDKAKLEKLASFWKEKLEAMPQFLNLPFDFPRQNKTLSQGDIEWFDFSESTLVEVKVFCQQLGITPFIYFLTIFQVLLFAISKQNKFLIGTPVSTRSEREFEALIGLFINTIILSCEIGENTNLKKLLQNNRDMLQETLAHILPFEILVELLHKKREFNLPPVFQVLFAYETKYSTTFSLDNLQVEYKDPIYATSKFDLSLFIVEQDTNLRARIEYKADLFTEVKIKKLLSIYQFLVTALLKQPEQSIAGLLANTAMLKEFGLDATSPATSANQQVEADSVEAVQQQLLTRVEQLSQTKRLLLQKRLTGHDSAKNIKPGNAGN